MFDLFPIASTQSQQKLAGQLALGVDQSLL